MADLNNRDPFLRLSKQFHFCLLLLPLLPAVQPGIWLKLTNLHWRTKLTICSGHVVESAHMISREIIKNTRLNEVLTWNFCYLKF